MRIAICDFQICECMEPLLQKYAAALPYISFDSMESLIESAKQEFFPLIFLYVEEEHSERLKQVQILMTGKQKPLIILVSETSTCAAEAFGIAFRYLLKPIQEKKFQEVLQQALQISNCKTITLTDDYGRTFCMPLQDILYFECQNYVVIAHTIDGQHAIRTRLKNVETLLAEYDFCRVHASFLINLHHISDFVKDDIKMINGSHINISRMRRKQFHAVFFSYLQKNAQQKLSVKTGFHQLS
ncbi:MAG: LytTR family transcriptional regulator DNA-binding domain-containing protein [Butyricicoccus pullicaecorum]|nr:LytTR family transcriptional regulator DNA-binding domain-containing protein [Butyricicoccus pullicaecorum]